jgi:hypothetical protein
MIEEKTLLEKSLIPFEKFSIPKLPPSTILPSSHVPKMSNFNYSYTLGNTSNIGLELSQSSSLGWAYSLPYYQERQYLTFGSDFSLEVAIETVLLLKSPFVRISLIGETVGARVTPSLRGYLDVTTFDDVCYSLDMEGEGLEFVLTAVVEVRDCSLGALGAFADRIHSFRENRKDRKNNNSSSNGTSAGTTGGNVTNGTSNFDSGWQRRDSMWVECEWKQYWLDQLPLVKISFDSLSSSTALSKWFRLLNWSRHILPMNCLNRELEPWEIN